MTRALLVLRPEPGASATAAVARAQGWAGVAAPLFEVTALDWTMPAQRPQAVLMTSANAARLAGAALGGLIDLPLYAVGDATAAAARDAGFDTVVVGTEGVDAIVARAGRDGIAKLLHLAGHDHHPPTAADLAIDRRFVYAANAVAALPETAAAALPAAIALLHSARAAALFRALIAPRVDPATISIAVLSDAVREAAGGGWRAVAVAERATDASLLAAAAKLCDHGG